MRIVPWWVYAIAAALVITAGVLVYGAIRHRGYVEGQSERESYYRPLLAASKAALEAANARARTEAEQARTISQNLEDQHVNVEKALASRALGAESRITELLRQRSAANRTALSIEEPPQALTATGDLGDAFQEWVCGVSTMPATLPGSKNGTANKKP